MKGEKRNAQQHQITHRSETTDSPDKFPQPHWELGTGQGQSQKKEQNQQ